MEGAVTGLYTKISELWDRKIENDEKIDALRNELERNKLTDALAAEIVKHEAKVSGNNDRNFLLWHANKWSHCVCRLTKWSRKLKSPICTEC